MKYTMLILYGQARVMRPETNWQLRDEIVVEVHLDSAWSSDPHGFTIYSDSAPELLNLDDAFKEALRREQIIFHNSEGTWT